MPGIWGCAILKLPFKAALSPSVTDCITLGKAMLYVTVKLPQGSRVEGVDINRYGKAG